MNKTEITSETSKNQARSVGCLSRWMAASDIHGSALYCRKLLERFNAEDKSGRMRLLLLGDILYHGPRNRLPDEYDPPAVIAMLNPLKRRILAVRGNCDSEVDQMVLDFPMLAEYAVLPLCGRIVYATHGHIKGPDKLPPLCEGDILLYGHTHVPKCEVSSAGDISGIICMNPGSVSLPKESSHRGYMIIEDFGNHARFIWKDLDGNIKSEYGIANSGNSDFLGIPESDFNQMRHL